MRISKGILSFETLRAARARGVQASDGNLTRFARSKALKAFDQGIASLPGYRSVAWKPPSPPAMMSPATGRPSRR